MNIKRYDIFPVNHQSGNEIESAGGRYVRFCDIECLQQRLTAAEQRNAELVELLRDSYLTMPCYNSPLKSDLRDRIEAAIKPTESGASE